MSYITLANFWSEQLPGLGLMLWSGNGMMDASDSSVLLCRKGSSVSIHCKCTQIIPKSWNKTLAQNFSNLQFVSIASTISVNTITVIKNDQMNMRWEENGFVCKRIAALVLVFKCQAVKPVDPCYADFKSHPSMTSWLQLRWQKLYARIGLVSWVLLTVIQAGLLQDSCCASFIPFHNLCLNEASKYRVDWDPLSVPTQIPKIIAGWISAWVYVLAEFVISCHFDSFASELAGELVGRPRGIKRPYSTTIHHWICSETRRVCLQ